MDAVVKSLGKRMKNYQVYEFYGNYGITVKLVYLGKYVRSRRVKYRRGKSRGRFIRRTRYSHLPARGKLVLLGSYFKIFARECEKDRGKEGKREIEK